MMEIPLILFVGIAGGLLAAYITILAYLFQFSKDENIDFAKTLENFRNREYERIELFVDDEIDQRESNKIPKRNDYEKIRNKCNLRIKKIMGERWSNARNRFKTEEVVDKLNKNEDIGQFLCFGGIVCDVFAFILYVVPWLNTHKLYVIMGLWFIPLIVIACLFCGNVLIRRKIRISKRTMENK